MRWATKTTISGKRQHLTHFNSQEVPEPVIFCHSILYRPRIPFSWVSFQTVSVNKYSCLSPGNKSLTQVKYLIRKKSLRKGRNLEACTTEEYSLDSLESQGLSEEELNKGQGVLSPVFHCLAFFIRFSSALTGCSVVVIEEAGISAPIWQV